MTEQIRVIPNEMLKIIPIFGGDKRLLNLFLRKCEYIILRYRGDEAQNLYVMHSITSRLIDDAAALLSEREDVVTWLELRELLIQHFGDPRSEECIAIELESLKIKSGEGFLEFCNRIQSVRSALISKVNEISDENIKKSKVSIYNNTSLNVFLYNLPESMVRIVRLSSPKTLEEALGVVLEEVNFHEQYKLRNRVSTSNPVEKSNPLKFGLTPQPNSFKFGLPPQPAMKFQPPNFSINKQMRPPNSFNFGQNPNQGQRPNLFNQNQFGYRPPNFNNQTQNLVMRPQQFGQQQQPQQFGIKPQQFGYRPFQFNNQPLKINPNQDVSMRTAPPLKPQQQKFPINETDLYENHVEDINNYCDHETYYTDCYTDGYIPDEVNEIKETFIEELMGNENFHITHDKDDPK